MKGKFFIPVLLMALVMMAIFFVPVSGQEIDVDNMDNTELTTLLLQIMQRLDQSGKTAEMPEPTATPTPEPTKTPQPELSDDKAELEALMLAIMQKLQQEEGTETAPKTPAGTMVPVSEAEDEPENSIWENKKLIIEGLPGYMFIQPTKEPKSEKTTSGDMTNGTKDDSHGFVWDDDVEYCPPPYSWNCYTDRCVCEPPRR